MSRKKVDLSTFSPSPERFGFKIIKSGARTTLAIEKTHSDQKKENIGMIFTQGLDFFVEEVVD